MKMSEFLSCHKRHNSTLALPTHCLKVLLKKKKLVGFCSTGWEMRVKDKCG